MKIWKIARDKLKAHKLRLSAASAVYEQGKKGEVSESEEKKLDDLVDRAMTDASVLVPGEKLMAESTAKGHELLRKIVLAKELMEKMDTDKCVGMAMKEAYAECKRVVPLPLPPPPPLPKSAASSSGTTSGSSFNDAVSAPKSVAASGATTSGSSINGAVSEAQRMREVEKAKGRKRKG